MTTPFILECSHQPINTKGTENAKNHNNIKTTEWSNKGYVFIVNKSISSIASIKTSINPDEVLAVLEEKEESNEKESENATLEQCNTRRQPFIPSNSVDDVELKDVAKIM